MDCQTIVSYQVAETGPTYAQFLKTNVRPLQYMFPIADVFEVVSGDLIMGEAHSVFHTTLTVNRPIRVIRLGAFFFSHSSISGLNGACMNACFFQTRACIILIACDAELHAAKSATTETLFW